MLLYIKNLPPEATKNHIRALFAGQQLDDILQVGTSAFLTFSTATEIVKAYNICETNNQEFEAMLIENEELIPMLQQLRLKKDSLPLERSYPEMNPRYHMSSYSERDRRHLESSYLEGDQRHSEGSFSESNPIHCDKSHSETNYKPSSRSTGENDPIFDQWEQYHGGQDVFPEKRKDEETSQINKRKYQVEKHPYTKEYQFDNDSHRISAACYEDFRGKISQEGCHRKTGSPPNEDCYKKQSSAPHEECQRKTSSVPEDHHRRISSPSFEDHDRKYSSEPFEDRHRQYNSEPHEDRHRKYSSEPHEDLHRKHNPECYEDRHRKHSSERYEDRHRKYSSERYKDRHRKYSSERCVDYQRKNSSDQYEDRHSKYSSRRYEDRHRKINSAYREHNQESITSGHEKDDQTFAKEPKKKKKKKEKVPEQVFVTTILNDKMKKEEFAEIVKRFVVDYNKEIKEDPVVTQYTQYNCMFCQVVIKYLGKYPRFPPIRIIKDRVVIFQHFDEADICHLCLGKAHEDDECSSRLMQGTKKSKAKSVVLDNSDSPLSIHSSFPFYYEGEQYNSIKDAVSTLQSKAFEITFSELPVVIRYNWAQEQSDTLKAIYWAQINTNSKVKEALEQAAGVAGILYVGEDMVYASGSIPGFKVEDLPIHKAPGLNIIGRVLSTIQAELKQKLNKRSFFVRNSDGRTNSNILHLKAASNGSEASDPTATSYYEAADSTIKNYSELVFSNWK